MRKVPRDRIFLERIVVKMYKISQFFAFFAKLKNGIFVLYLLILYFQRGVGDHGHTLPAQRQPGEKS
jgi:hypothetical protein